MHKTTTKSIFHKGLVVFRVFCLALTFMLVDKEEFRNPLRHIA